MRAMLLAVVVAAAAALAAASVAGAGMMHPDLGARLSGMGHHGVVNLQSHMKKGRLCWKFDLHVTELERASIRDAQGMVVARLGKTYKPKGCTMAAKKALRLIESKPGRYVVWVDTKGHPGELRGKLHAGMAHM
jgi:hypothetical protein